MPSFIHSISISHAFTVGGLWAQQEEWDALPDLKEFSVWQETVSFITVHTSEGHAASATTGVVLLRE